MSKTQPNYSIEKTDVLIALHACDTATDDAIFKGIKAEAEWIICSPCCHKQVRKEMISNNPWKDITRFGILMEREAEILTDSIRALLMEAHGYKTQIFEFISSEHTGKNLMIIGQKTGNIPERSSMVQRIEALKAPFGIKRHYLEDLLGF